MDQISEIQSLGFSWLSPAYLFGAFFFGILGFAAYRYGAKTERVRVKWMGVALMLYPYAISQTWLLYGVGVVLCVAIYVFWE